MKEIEASKGRSRVKIDRTKILLRLSKLIMLRFFCQKWWKGKVKAIYYLTKDSTTYLAFIATKIHLFWTFKPISDIERNGVETRRLIIWKRKKSPLCASEDKGKKTCSNVDLWRVYCVYRIIIFFSCD